MRYPGKAYKEAKVKPGDLMNIIDRDGRCLSRFPHGVLIVTPEEAMQARPRILSGDPDRYVYVTGLPDKDDFNGYETQNYGITIGSVAFTPLTEIPSVSSQSIPLKKQNDAGGADGKCVSCNTHLKEWTRGRFYCPKCEP